MAPLKGACHAIYDSGNIILQGGKLGGHLALDGPFSKLPRHRQKSVAMRALFIDTNNKEVSVVNLPDNEAKRNAKVKELLQVELLATMPAVKGHYTFLFDRDYLSNDTGYFTCGLLRFEIIGPAILLGKDPATGFEKAVDKDMTPAQLNVTFKKFNISPERIAEIGGMAADMAKVLHRLAN